MHIHTVSTSRLVDVFEVLSTKLLPVCDLTVNFLIMPDEDEDCEREEGKAKRCNGNAASEGYGIPGCLRLDKNVRGDEVGAISYTQNFTKSV